MTTTTTFSKIPAELIEGVYQWLDARSIFRLSQVSHQFRRVLQQSSALEYKMRLELSGFRDGLKPGVSSERLAMLEAYQAAWTSFHPNQCDSKSVLMDGHLWELVGNVLVTYSAENGFRFNRIPSSTRHILPAAWSVASVPFAVSDFSLDLSQDLLLVVEINHNVKVNTVIHLLSLQNGGPHPLARKAGLSPDIDSSDYPAPHHFQIRIFGDHVGVLTDSIDRVELIVWEWKTGNLKKHLFDDDMTSFAFLDDYRLLISVYTALSGLPPELRVLEIDGHLTEMIGYFSFKLPAFSPLHEVPETEIVIHTEPRTSWATDSDLNEPFATSLTDRLFVVSLWGETLHATDPTFMLCFLLSALLNIMGNPPEGTDDRSIVWDKWGPGTRMLRVPQLPDPWVCFVYGQRCILLTDQTHYKILDFNPLSTSQNRITHEKTVDKRQRLFLHPVTTSAPFALLSVDVSPSAAVMLAEDAIVTVSPNEEEFTIFYV
ncbi:hypothetical protein DFH07DRAFT_24480 [Mycena maculata]|uniref:F-box domain-containing protein n=1 Tax=Mycena maculata TaxID=230809 RepID=A0AAD7IJB7_9AGAR|nr:hypothetical protein DFH07DRAFT_24480 [Mycena maculata]